MKLGLVLVSEVSLLQWKPVEVTEGYNHRFKLSCLLINMDQSNGVAAAVWRLNSDHERD